MFGYLLRGRMPEGVHDEGRRGRYVSLATHKESVRVGKLGRMKRKEFDD